MATMNTLQPQQHIVAHSHPSSSSSSSRNKFPHKIITSCLNLGFEPRKNAKNNNNKMNRLAESFSNLLNLHIEAPSIHNMINFHDDDDEAPNFTNMMKNIHETPAKSPKENISAKWREIHGFHDDWENLLDPLHPCLRREIIKYGEFAQATYDAFDFDSFSEYCGSCRYNKDRLLEKCGMGECGYDVTRYVYAMSHMDNVPRWLQRSNLMTDAWSRDSNWMGFVAVSDDAESVRIGRRDIVVAWRGTVAPSEWYEDFQRKLEPVGHGEAKVEHGFLSMYTSKSDHTRYNKWSASEQVMKEVKKLVSFYKARGEEVSLTITGHSLGGALSLLTAYEAGWCFPGLPISVMSFGAPRVGNIAFRDELCKLGVKTLRVTVKQDIVPRMPGIVLNESLQKYDDITGTLEWVYTHVGVELKLDVRCSPYLKKGFNPMGIHMLETYLHLVDGFVTSGGDDDDDDGGKIITGRRRRRKSSFRLDAKRDVVLVNKTSDMLLNELRIPEFWFQLANKGLVLDESSGRWVKPSRDPEDIPSPMEQSWSSSFPSSSSSSHTNSLLQYDMDDNDEYYDIGSLYVL